MMVKTSPHLSMQSVARIKRAFVGDSADQSNPFHWETVALNLSGSEEYNPSMPWIMKLRHDKSVAVDLHTYIDDARITG